MTPLVRTAIAGMTLSAAGLSGLAVDEQFRSEAYIPVPGDRWTYGFASTFKADGSPVQKGDKIDPVSALKLKLQHINVDEAKLKQCVTGTLYQREYDILVSFAYQYGVPATCKSTLVKNINQGSYPQACQQYARWTMVDGKDCRAAGSTCPGVATRADRRVQDCLAAGQQEATRVPIEVIAPPEKPGFNWLWVVGMLAFFGAGWAAYVWKRK